MRDILAEIWGYLSLRRRLKKITQAELARRMGTHQSAVSEAERLVTPNVTLRTFIGYLRGMTQRATLVFWDETVIDRTIEIGREPQYGEPDIPVRVLDDFVRPPKHLSIKPVAIIPAAEYGADIKDYLLLAAQRQAEWTMPFPAPVIMTARIARRYA